MERFTALRDRVASLGNHYGKYLETIRRYQAELIAALEADGKVMDVRFWDSSPEPIQEMRIIRGLGGEVSTCVQRLSCYYAAQYLHMHFRHLDVLSMEVNAGEGREQAYLRFMRDIGNDFRRLTRGYMENILALYLPPPQMEEFFLCSVGTRADQDDIDVGIVTSGRGDEVAINRAVQRLTQHMLVYATRLHLYLSEHIGRQMYTTTIAEYAEALDERIGDVVILSELVNAKLILGSESLFEHFQQQVVARYFHESGWDSRYHEGFLRGILGEARALLLSPLPSGSIAPKEDAIRMIKQLLYAKKARYALPEVNAWDILSALSACEPRLVRPYEQLYQSISFLEMFRFMLQLYLTQDEVFAIDVIDPEPLAQIAECMGYQPMGNVSGWDRLLVDYYRQVEEARSIGEFLLRDLTVHLSTVSVFTGMLHGASEPEAGDQVPDDLARTFIEQARFFSGTRYWDDVLQRLQADQGLLDRFINSLERLAQKEQASTIAAYIAWAEYTPITIMRLLTIIAERLGHAPGLSLYNRMIDGLLEQLERTPHISERLCRVFGHYPVDFHRFLNFLPDEHFDRLEVILSRPLVDERLTDCRERVLLLLDIHRWSSPYFHRFFSRIIAKHPEYLSAIPLPRRMQTIASGMLAQVDLHTDPALKLEVLGDYYDLEFLRVGIGTLRGATLEETNRAFTDFCDHYIRKMFDICCEQIEREFAVPPLGTDAFALLAAGGHARGQAYDDDYDLIAVAGIDDPELTAYASRVVSRMNREIRKRGVLPHYRLGDVLGCFVPTVSQIVDYLCSEDPERFIDLSQLFGARMLVGSTAMETLLQQRVLTPFVYEQRQAYRDRMAGEIRQRRLPVEAFGEEACNIKEAPGGLRDIEGILLTLKAWVGIGEPLVEETFHRLAEQLPELAEPLSTLDEAMKQLRTLRDLYRLTVAADDTVRSEYLERITRSRRLSGKVEPIHMEGILQTLETSSAACATVLDYLEALPAGPAA